MVYSVQENLGQIGKGALLFAGGLFLGCNNFYNRGPKGFSLVTEVEPYLGLTLMVAGIWKIYKEAWRLIRDYKDNNRKFFVQPVDLGTKVLAALGVATLAVCLPPFSESPSVVTTVPVLAGGASVFESLKRVCNATILSPRGTSIKNRAAQDNWSFIRNIAPIRGIWDGIKKTVGHGVAVLGGVACCYSAVLHFKDNFFWGIGAGLGVPLVYNGWPVWNFFGHTIKRALNQTGDSCAATRNKLDPGPFIFTAIVCAQAGAYQCGVPWFCSLPLAILAGLGRVFRYAEAASSKIPLYSLRSNTRVNVEDRSGAVLAKSVTLENAYEILLRIPLDRRALTEDEKEEILKFKAPKVDLMDERYQIILDLFEVNLLRPEVKKALSSTPEEDVVHESFGDFTGSEMTAILRKFRKDICADVKNQDKKAKAQELINKGKNKEKKAQKLINEGLMIFKELETPVENSRFKIA